MRQVSCIVVAVALAVMSAMPAAAEDFPIIFLLEPEKNLDEPATLAFVDGGYVSGLEVGMVGSLIRADGVADSAATGCLKDVVVEVHDVSAWESACVIRGLHWIKIPAHVAVRVEVPDLDTARLHRLGSEAATARQYRKAQHYFEQLLLIDSLSVDSSIHDLLSQCRSEVEDEDNRQLSRKMKRAEKKRSPVYHALGAYFFAHNKPEAARHYLERAVRFGKKNEHAEHLLWLIGEGETCMPTVDTSVALDVFPEMVYEAEIEYPRVARLAEVTGVVWVQALVDKTGVVIQVRIGRSSCFWLLDQAALQQAQLCRYKPGIQKGKPVACWVTYRVLFLLG
ncbi:MAG: TonB family protein [candidate division Zixibacteria bacterium]|nr:TonB family protein [candidate division Zixibacteria bacterium]